MLTGVEDMNISKIAYLFLLKKRTRNYFGGYHCDGGGWGKEEC